MAKERVIMVPNDSTRPACRYSIVPCHTDDDDDLDEVGRRCSTLNFTLADEYMDEDGMTTTAS